MKISLLSGAWGPDQSPSGSGTDSGGEPGPGEGMCGNPGRLAAILSIPVG